MFCTVFTPTYNRMKCIKKLYDSLCMQTDKDFEWVVIDDGSDDGTEDWFCTLDKHSFRIVYKKVENGGKHRAINKGLDLAQGRVFAIVDSDDYLSSTAISKLKEMFATIEDSEKKFCGVAGLRVHENGTIVGTTFATDYVDAKSTDREKYNINGDKFEVFYTDVLKENKFPEIEGERFLTEATVWYRLSRKGYYIRWFNVPLYYCEYLEDGLTSNQNRLFSDNPKGYALFVSERIKEDHISSFKKMVYVCNYYDVRHHRVSKSEIAKELNIAISYLYVSIAVRAIYRNLKQ